MNNGEVKTVPNAFIFVDLDKAKWYLDDMIYGEPESAFELWTVEYERLEKSTTTMVRPLDFIDIKQKSWKIFDFLRLDYCKILKTIFCNYHKEPMLSSARVAYNVKLQEKIQ